MKQTIEEIEEKVQEIYNLCIMKWEKDYNWAVIGWLLAILVPPVTTALTNQSVADGWNNFINTFPFITILIVTFFCNLLWLSPRLLHDGNKRYFIVSNVLLMAVCLAVYQLINPFSNTEGLSYILSVTSGRAIVTFVVMVVAHLMCSSSQRSTLKKLLAEEQSKRHEAELTMLKTQLNPHFLFNTLNNISSMVQIDPEQAQESIGQLSDLLRYTLYESSAAQVPLSNEIEFMGNYIGLMKLRYSNSAEIEVDMPEPTENIQIAPLLFISLIENAFKHGVSSCEPSFVNISLKVQDGWLSFSCENSLFPDQQTDHVGSGIGLENMKKRLELAYNGRYEYKTNTTNGIYKANVKIQLA